MMLTDKYPILEYDNNREAKVNPIALADKSFETDKLVLTFFPEVMDKLKEEGKISLEIEIPVGATASVRLPNHCEQVGQGKYRYEMNQKGLSL